MKWLTALIVGIVMAFITPLFIDFHGRPYVQNVIALSFVTVIILVSALLTECAVLWLRRSRRR